MAKFWKLQNLLRLNRRRMFLRYWRFLNELILSELYQLQIIYPLSQSSSAWNVSLLWKQLLLNEVKSQLYSCSTFGCFVLCAGQEKAQSSSVVQGISEFWNLPFFFFFFPANLQVPFYRRQDPIQSFSWCLLDIFFNLCTKFLYILVNLKPWCGLRSCSEIEV